MSRVKFYDLEAEANTRIQEAERKHMDRQVLNELAAIKEATQSLCALMMGIGIKLSSPDATMRHGAGQ